LQPKPTGCVDGGATGWRKGPWRKGFPLRTAVGVRSTVQAALNSPGVTVGEARVKEKKVIV